MQIVAGNLISSTAQINPGVIVDSDINASAAIALTKVATSNAIVNADINTGAAIVDTKLATISTAGKVSGAALTSLSSIPAGAGLVPTANLPTLGGGNFGRITSDVTIDSASVSTTETDILSCSLTGNKMGANGLIRFMSYVSYTCANANVPVLTIKLYIGGTLVGTMALNQGDATSRTYTGYIMGIIQNANSTSSQRGDCFAYLQKVGGGITYSAVPWMTASGTGTAAIDTTTAQTVKATATFFNTACGIITIKSAFFEVVPVLA